MMVKINIKKLIELFHSTGNSFKFYFAPLISSFLFSTRKTLTKKNYSLEISLFFTPFMLSFHNLICCEWTVIKWMKKILLMKSTKSLFMVKVSRIFLIFNQSLYCYFVDSYSFFHRKIFLRFPIYKIK